MTQDETAISRGRLPVFTPSWQRNKIKNGSWPELTSPQGSEVVGRSLNYDYLDMEPAAPLPPTLSSEGVVSIDITDKFIQAAKSKLPLICSSDSVP